MEKINASIEFFKILKEKNKYYLMPVMAILFIYIFIIDSIQFFFKINYYKKIRSKNKTILSPNTKTTIPVLSKGIIN